MKRKIILAIVTLVVLTGSVMGATLQKRVHVQKEFDLKAGREVIVKEPGIKLSFIKLEEDSRCPEGVDCIWAGNGKITMSVQKGKHKSVSFELNTTTEPKSFIYQGHEITLVKLAPYPKANVEIKKSQYVATLIVKRIRS